MYYFPKHLLLIHLHLYLRDIFKLTFLINYDQDYCSLNAEIGT